MSNLKSINENILNAINLMDPESKTLALDRNIKRLTGLQGVLHLDLADLEANDTNNYSEEYSSKYADYEETVRFKELLQEMRVKL